MDLTITTPPSLTSIDATLVKANKRIRHASEDSLIDFWIDAADRHIEKETNRALLTQTMTLRINKILPVIQLPRPPLASITSINYTPQGGDEVIVTVPDDIVQRTVDMLPTVRIPSIESAYGECSETDGTMTIVYVAGWASSNAIPADLRLAALLLASHWLTSREAAHMDLRVMNVEKKIPFGVDALIGNFRITNNNQAINGGW